MTVNIHLRCRTWHYGSCVWSSYMLLWSRTCVPCDSWYLNGIDLIILPNDRIESMMIVTRVLFIRHKCCRGSERTSWSLVLGRRQTYHYNCSIFWSGKAHRIGHSSDSQRREWRTRVLGSFAVLRNQYRNGNRRNCEKEGRDILGAVRIKTLLS